jgi:tetratricopeptide (TPR) repeat protein
MQILLSSPAKRSSSLLAVAGLILTLVAAPAQAQQQSGKPMKVKAERHFNRGVTFFRKGKFAKAATAFSKAHAMEPRTDILFAWAQMERLAGDCDKAVELYRQLESAEDLGDADKAAVDDGLERCGATEEPEPEPPPAVEPPPPPPPKIVTKVITRDAPPPWWADPLGGALVGSGVVLLGVGTGFLVVSISDSSAADDATTYEAHETLQSRAKSRRTIALVSMGVGAGLVAGGVVRYLLLPDSKSTEVAVLPTEGGAAITWGGHF